MEKEYVKQHEEHIEKLTTEILAGLPVFVTKFYNHIIGKAPNTVYGYISDVKAFLEYYIDTPECPVEKIEEITPQILGHIKVSEWDDYKAYLIRYEKSHNTKDGEKVKILKNGNASINRKFASLRRLMDYLWSSEEIETRNIFRVEKVTEVKREVVRLNESEVKKVISSASTGGTKVSDRMKKYNQNTCIRDTAIITLFLSTGLRISELIGIDIGDIDFEECTINVYRKGREYRTVSFSDECCTYLADYHELRKNICPKEGHEKAFFLSIQKKRITKQALTNMIHKFTFDATGRKDISAHKFRSTYASAMLEASDDDLYMVSKALNHKQISTIERYLHTDVEKRVRTARNNVKLTD